MGWVLAATLWLALADESKAQFSLSIGGPAYGQGYSVAGPTYAYGTGYGTGNPYGYPGYAPSYVGGYGNTYRPNVIAGPRYGTYSSGYSGYVANPNTGYQTLNHYYGAYGYGNYGYGSRDGFRPFRRFR